MRRRRHGPALPRPRVPRPRAGAGALVPELRGRLTRVRVPRSGRTRGATTPRRSHARASPSAPRRSASCARPTSPPCWRAAPRWRRRSPNGSPAHGRTVAPRGHTTLVAFEDDDPEATRDRLLEAGVARPQPPGHPARARVRRRVVERGRPRAPARRARSSARSDSTSRIPLCSTSMRRGYESGGAVPARRAARAPRRLSVTSTVPSRSSSCSSVRGPTIGDVTPAGRRAATPARPATTVAPLDSAIARASSTARKLRSIARRAGASSRSSPASPIRDPAGGGSSRE